MTRIKKTAFATIVGALMLVSPVARAGGPASPACAALAAGADLQSGRPAPVDSVSASTQIVVRVVNSHPDNIQC